MSSNLLLQGSLSGQLDQLIEIFAQSMSMSGHLRHHDNAGKNAKELAKKTYAALFQTISFEPERQTIAGFLKTMQSDNTRKSLNKCPPDSAIITLNRHICVQLTADLNQATLQA